MPPIWLIKPLIALVICAGLAFVAHRAWSGFTGGYVIEGEQQQSAKDKPLLDAATKRADESDARADRADESSVKCALSLGKQNEAVTKAEKRADDAQAETKRTREAQKLENVVKEDHIRQLRAEAAAPPKLMACSEELLRAKTILQETLRSRRGLPIPSSEGKTK